MPKLIIYLFCFAALHKDKCKSFDKFYIKGSENYSLFFYKKEVKYWVTLQNMKNYYHYLQRLKFSLSFVVFVVWLSV